MLVEARFSSGLLFYFCRKSAFSLGRLSTNAGSPLSVWGAFLQMQEALPRAEAAFLVLRILDLGENLLSVWYGSLPCTKAAFPIIRKLVFRVANPYDEDSRPPITRASSARLRTPVFS